MQLRRTRSLGVTFLFLLALCTAGCHHRTWSWAQSVPKAEPAGMIEQPIWANYGK